MSRDRSAPQIAADVARHSGGVALLEMLFDSGALRLCLGPWNITIGADVYTATAGLLTVSEQQESADGVEGLDFSMSGLDPAIFDLAMLEPYTGRLVRLLEQRYDEADAPAGVPSGEYVGRIKAMTSSESPKDGKHTVTVQTEHFDAEGQRPRALRFSDAEQRRRFPADKGAEYATNLTERSLSRKPKV